jgi:transcriptional regulator with XRE-family HTH domain
MTEQIHIGKRIKFFREQRGLTQRQLGNGSGLLEASIRKYEIGQRNPKPDQIKKIADALGVTVYALAPPKIETDADVTSLILAIDEKVGIKFDGKKDSKRNLDSKTLTLHIDDHFVNDALARWGNAKNHLERMKSTDVPKGKRKEHNAMITEYEADIEEAKNGLMGSNMIVGKDQKGISVKINPDFSTYIKTRK